MSVNHIGEEEFTKEVLEAKEPVFVDFYADWCGPCQMMSPVIDEMSEELANVKFGKVNIDDYPDIAANYGIMSIPTILVFKGGEVSDTFIGVTAKDKILDALK